MPRVNPPPTSETPPAEQPVLLTDAQIWGLQLKMPAWLSGNPGLAFTLVYVSASVVGLLYNFLFFRRFGINVLEFCETTDFLMVVVREPLTVAMAMSGVLVYVAYMGAVRLTTQWVYQRWPRLRSSPEKRLKGQAKLVVMARVIRVAFIAVYAFLFVQLYSIRQARIVRQEPRTWVTLDYKADAPTRAGKLNTRAVLLGTTTRFVFIYQPETKESEAVPLDAIARLNWDARTKRERTADEEKKKTGAQETSAVPVETAPAAKVKEPVAP